MPKILFSAGEFTPTEFSTAQDKAAFGNYFFRFIEAEWKESIFTKGFYNRLSSCFGHIAHYVEGAIMRSVGTKTAWTATPTPNRFA